MRNPCPNHDQVRVAAEDWDTIPFQIKLNYRPSSHTLSSERELSLTLTTPFCRKLNIVNRKQIKLKDAFFLLSFLFIYFF